MPILPRAIFQQAGLLASESSSLCTFPVSQWHLAKIVVGYSGGTALDFHQTSLLNKIPVNQNYSITLKSIESNCDLFSQFLITSLILSP